MRKVKYILLLVIILLFTGCNGEYNINLNEDLSINEEINFSIENKDDAYEKTLKLFENNNIDDSKYNVTQSEDYVNITYEEKFSNFEDYILNSKFYNLLIDNQDYKKDNKSIYYRSFINLKLDDESNTDLNNSYYITNLNINFKSPFKMKFNNADSLSDDTYTWNLSTNDTFKKINFSLDYLNKNNGSIVLIILCVGILGVTAFVVITNYLKGKKL